MRILILGSISNRALKKLCKWFNVKSFKELPFSVSLISPLYTLKTKDTFYRSLRAVIVESNLTFLVRRAAQLCIFADCSTLRLPLWSQEKYIGLPHPFAHNKPKDIEIKNYITNVLRSKL